MNLDATKQAFLSHGFACSVWDSAEDATAYLRKACQGKSVSLGGSMTLEELGLFDVLQGANIPVSWHWRAPGVYVQTPDVYIASANALSQTGEAIHIDGFGNRVSALTYGAKRCYLVCGQNKVVPTLHDAIDRARNIAAPQNAKRLGIKTPCVVDGNCHDCHSPARICRAMSILFAPPSSFESFEVVLIRQSLGY